MRPLGPGSMTSPSDGLRGVRHEDREPTCGGPFSSTASLSCFLATESELDAADGAPFPPPSRHSRARMPKSQSKTDMCQSNPNASGADNESSLNMQSSSTDSQGVAVPCRSSSSSPSPTTTSPIQGSRFARHQASHHHSPLTPLFAALSAAQSTLSSSSSRRNSLTASSLDLQDSFIASSGVSQLGEAAHIDSPLPIAHGGRPSPALSFRPETQLVIPSVSIPKRRPFSETGKTIGKLRILVAGSSGIGKTSLIQSMARCCEHLVHLDVPVSSSLSSFTEIYGSTRSQPWWQSDLDSSMRHSSRRGRLSISDEILDRNICFMEAKGDSRYGMREIMHIESQYRTVASKAIEEVDSRNLISNGSLPLVDAVLYMLPHQGPTANDIQAMKTLHDLTNLIPLVSRADELGQVHLTEVKEHLKHILLDNDVSYFSFSTPDASSDQQDIYAISCKSHPDLAMMDASVLMSSDYIVPLVPTDLDVFVGQLFSAEGSSWLRNSVAAKYLKWSRANGAQFRQSETALARRSLTPNYPHGPILVVNPFAQRQHWRRVSMSNWAEDLRQSLEAQSAEARLQQGQLTLSHPRQGWPMAITRRHRRGGSKSKWRSSPQVEVEMHQDPLGLLELGNPVKIGGQAACQLLGGIGVVVVDLVGLDRDDYLSLSRWVGSLFD